MRAGDVARLVSLAAIWGTSFVFTRVVAAPLGAWWTSAGRVAIAGIVLAAWFASVQGDAALRKHWRAYLFTGAISSALPFLLYAYAALTLPASYLVILNALTPLWAALLASVWLRERLTGRKLAGIALGIAGVSLVSRAGMLAIDGPVLLAVVASVGATLAYAIGGVWIKRHGTALEPRAVAAWSQVSAAAVLLPPAVVSGMPPGPVTPLVTVNLLGLGILCTGLAYLLYFRLIRDLGPTRALTVTFLMPAFGMVLGAVLLGEAITLPMLGGAALVTLGTWLVLRSPAPGARTASVR